MLDSGDTGGQSWQACTALAEGCQASAVRREAVLTDQRVCVSSSVKFEFCL